LSKKIRTIDVPVAVTKIDTVAPVPLLADAADATVTAATAATTTDSGNDD